MIDKFNRRITILDKQSPASLDDIALLQDRFPNVPADFLNIVREATEVELKLSDTQSKYVRIWGPKGCLEFVDAYHISTYLPEGIPIGDDGSGRCLIYMTGNSGWGLYLCDFSVLDRNSARWIAENLTEFLVDGIGTTSI